MMDVGLVNDGPVSDEPPREMPTTPCIGLDFSSLDEEVQAAQNGNCRCDSERFY